MVNLVGPKKRAYILQVICCGGGEGNERGKDSGYMLFNRNGSGTAQVIEEQRRKTELTRGERREE